MDLSKDEVVSRVTEAVTDVMDGLGNVELMLHHRGYGQWATAITNLRTDVEGAMHKFIDTMEGDK